MYYTGVTFFLLDQRGAGLHLAFQFLYVLTEGGREGELFVSVDQILVPTLGYKFRGVKFKYENLTTLA